MFSENQQESIEGLGNTEPTKFKKKAVIITVKKVSLHKCL